MEPLPAPKFGSLKKGHEGIKCWFRKIWPYYTVAYALLAAILWHCMLVTWRVECSYIQVSVYSQVRFPGFVFIKTKNICMCLSLVVTVNTLMTGFASHHLMHFIHIRIMIEPIKPCCWWAIIAGSHVNVHYASCTGYFCWKITYWSFLKIKGANNEYILHSNKVLTIVCWFF